MLVHLQVLAVLCHRAHRQGLRPGEQEPGGEVQAVCLNSFIITSKSNKSNIVKINYTIQVRRNEDIIVLKL